MPWELIEGLWHTKYFGPTLRIKLQEVKHPHGDMSFWELEILSDQGWKRLHAIAKQGYSDSEVINRLKAYAQKLYI